MHNLTPAVSTRRVINATAAGTSDINGADIDMTGYEGARCVVALGALTGTQVTLLKAEEADDNGSGAAGSYTAITGAATAAAADADSNKLLVLEVFRPKKKWLRFVVDRGTANAVVDSGVAELTRPSHQATAQHSTVSQQKVLRGP